MGLISFFLSTFRRIIFVLFMTLITLPFLPDTMFPDFPFDPQPIVQTNLDKSLPWNNVLSQKAEKLFTGRLIGPESLALKDNFIYTGLEDGRIVEVNIGTLQIRTVTSFAPKNSKVCTENMVTDLSLCGRPLGMRFGPNGVLYALEASRGLFSIGVSDGSKTWLALGPSDKKLPKEFLGLYNDFAFDPNDPNVVYVSLTSNKWDVKTIIWAFLEGRASGSILAVDLKTKKVVKVVDKLTSNNGIEVSVDRKSLLIACTSTYSIVQVTLDDIYKAIRTGTPITQPTNFLTQLAGMPDNIRRSAAGTGSDYHVAFTSVMGQSVLESYLTRPEVVKAVGRAFHLISRLLDTILTYKDCSCLRRLSTSLRSGQMAMNFALKKSGLLVIDHSGVIKYLLGSDDIPAISEVLLHPKTGDVYLGSFRNNFLGMVKAKYIRDAMPAVNMAKERARAARR